MYIANETRYDSMIYNRCGSSGLKLPALSLGLWQNFGYQDNFENMEQICHTAFDLGITCFDIANNYGNPYNGSAEENFGKILSRGMYAYRDEMIITTKAGYDMWPGPYGNRNGSRKYLIASLDQSLKRLGLDYVDIYYHHIFDPNTPLEETAEALDHIVRQGKALYVGISNYTKQQTADIIKILKELKTPFLINQPSYSILNRWIERDGLDKYAAAEGFGLAVFSPLYQGLLTNRYLNGIPKDSRIGKGRTWIQEELNDEMLAKLKALNEIAQKRGQTLSQMALSWILRDDRITSVILGASRPEQIAENMEALNNTTFFKEELDAIDAIVGL